MRNDKIAAEVWKTTGGESFQSFEAGFEYDPIADKLVGFAKDQKVYVLDPDKKEWVVNSPPGAPKENPWGPFGRWRYVPSLNAFVVVTHISENVHFTN